MEEESVLVRNSLIFGISKLGKGDMIGMFSIKVGDSISRCCSHWKFSLVVAGCYTLISMDVSIVDSYGMRVYAGYLLFWWSVVLSSVFFLLVK